MGGTSASAQIASWTYVRREDERSRDGARPGLTSPRMPCRMCGCMAALVTEAEVVERGLGAAIPPSTTHTPFSNGQADQRAANGQLVQVWRRGTTARVQPRVLCWAGGWTERPLQCCCAV